MKSTRQSHRYPVDDKQRACALCVITFKNLEWNDHTAHLVDLSRHGVGIELDAKIEPGFVWFKDRVGGYKAGVLMWSRQTPDGKHRAGIRFIPLSRKEELFLNEQIALVRAKQPLQDPVAVITTIMESLTSAGIPPSIEQPPPRHGGDDDIIGQLRDIISKT